LPIEQLLLMENGRAVRLPLQDVSLGFADDRPTVDATFAKSFNGLRRCAQRVRGDGARGIQVVFTRRRFLNTPAALGCGRTVRFDRAAPFSTVLLLFDFQGVAARLPTSSVAARLAERAIRSG